MLPFLLPLWCTCYHLTIVFLLFLVLIRPLKKTHGSKLMALSVPPSVRLHRATGGSRTIVIRLGATSA